MNNFDKMVQDLIDGVDNTELVNQDIDEIPAMVPVVYEPMESALTNEENPDLDEDYKFARSNIYGLIGKANAALELALKVAIMTESTKNLDTAAQIIQASNNLTKSLLDLQKQVKDSKKNVDNKTPTAQTIINNNYFSKEESEEVNNIIDQLDDIE